MVALGHGAPVAALCCYLIATRPLDLTGANGSGWEVWALSFTCAYTMADMLVMVRHAALGHSDAAPSAEFLN